MKSKRQFESFKPYIYIYNISFKKYEKEKKNKKQPDNE